MPALEIGHMSLLFYSFGEGTLTKGKVITFYLDLCKLVLYVRNNLQHAVIIRKIRPNRLISIMTMHYSAFYTATFQNEKITLFYNLFVTIHSVSSAEK